MILNDIYFKINFHVSVFPLKGNKYITNHILLIQQSNPS